MDEGTDTADAARRLRKDFEDLFERNLRQLCRLLVGLRLRLYCHVALRLEQLFHRAARPRRTALD